MWYDDIDEDERSLIVDEAKSDEYWRRLEEFWYKFRPHTLDKDFEELCVYEIEDLKRKYEEYYEERLNPEKFYMTGGL